MEIIEEPIKNARGWLYRQLKVQTKATYTQLNLFEYLENKEENKNEKRRETFRRRF